MANGNGYTAEQCITAAKDSRGFVTTIAKRLGCTRSYVYQLQKKYKTFAEAILDEREGLKDFAEGKLFSQIDEGNTTAIIFYLKTQAKERGYVERQEQYTFDLSKATDEQLQRIANGESPATVMASSG
jgi:hypothetical protein